MPIFEYICNDCGHTFEVLTLAAGKEKQSACPVCSSLSVKKKLSAFAINSGNDSARPDCSTGCGCFEQGTCGSGLCGGHH